MKQNNSSNSRDELKLKLQRKLQLMDESHKKEQQAEAKKLQKDTTDGVTDSAHSVNDEDFSYTSFANADATKSLSAKWVSIKKGEKHKLIEKNIRKEERKWSKFDKISDVDDKVHAINQDRFNKALLKSGGVKTHDNVEKLKKAKKSLDKKKEKSRDNWNDRKRAQTQKEDQKTERRSAAAGKGKGKGKGSKGKGSKGKGSKGKGKS